MPKNLSILFALLFAILSMDSIRCETPIPIDRFTTRSEGEFQSWIDRRDLLVMHHPWVPSATGGYCEASATVSLPSDLEPPVRLSLYQSDDYFNDFWRAKNDSWLGGDGFFGHRFKQIWAGDLLLWESDVADANPPKVSGVLTLDLPDQVVNEEEVTLTLKVVDKVSSWVELASDTQHISTTEVAAEKPEDPAKYWTHVYWGDVQILSGTEEVEGVAPSQGLLHVRKDVEASPNIKPPYSMRLFCSSPLPTGGFPARCGVPLAKDSQGDPRKLSLKREDGSDVASRIEDFTQPVDGWQKWMAVESLAEPGLESSELKLTRSGQVGDGNSLFLGNTESPPDVWIFEGNDSGIKTCKAAVDLHFASCEIRFDPEHIGDLVELPLIGLDGRATTINLGYSDRVALATPEFDSWVVESPSWMAIDIGEQHHFVSLRWIEGIEATRFNIERTNTTIQVSLLPYFIDGQAKPYPATPGEAKTFELLYCRSEGEYSEEDFQQLAGNFNQPPLLINTETLGQTGVWGEALPTTETVGEELTQFLKNNYPDPLNASFQWGKQLRDYGDIIYQGTDSWRNGYYDVRQGFAAAYLISGSREWADALDRSVRHYLDVDMIHWSGDHPDHVGLPHGYGENHTSMEPWNPITRVNGIFAAAHLWANVEYYNDAVRMAKQVAITERAVGASSVRDHAGVMMTLATAYRETRDPIFQEAGKKLIEDIASHRVDTRRGTYPEVHGNWNYSGNVPWMVAQLMEPLYIYYRETGDLQAASLMVGMADSILAENQTRGVPGDIHGYSHNPHFTKSSGYHVLIAPCLFYAYDLTGDETFREAGLAAWEQTVREGTINSVLNCFWNTPALVYYLRELEEE